MCSSIIILSLSSSFEAFRFKRIEDFRTALVDFVYHGSVLWARDSREVVPSSLARFDEDGFCVFVFFFVLSTVLFFRDKPFSSFMGIRSLTLTIVVSLWHGFRVLSTVLFFRGRPFSSFMDIRSSTLTIVVSLRHGFRRTMIRALSRPFCLRRLRLECLRIPAPENDSLSLRTMEMTAESVDRVEAVWFDPS